jgi:hypothetical protein
LEANSCVEKSLIGLCVFQGSITKALGNIRVGKGGEANDGPLSNRSSQFHHDDSFGSSPSDYLPPVAPNKERRQRSGDAGSPESSSGGVCNNGSSNVGRGVGAAGNKHIRGTSVSETDSEMSLLTVTPV